MNTEFNITIHVLQSNTNIIKQTLDMLNKPYLQITTKQTIPHSIFFTQPTTNRSYLCEKYLLKRQILIEAKKMNIPITTPFRDIFINKTSQTPMEWIENKNKMYSSSKLEGTMNNIIQQEKNQHTIQTKTNIQIKTQTPYTQHIQTLLQKTKQLYLSLTFQLSTKQLTIFYIKDLEGKTNTHIKEELKKHIHTYLTTINMKPARTDIQYNVIQTKKPTTWYNQIKRLHPSAQTNRS